MASYRERSIAVSDCFAAMRSSSAVISGLKFGVATATAIGAGGDEVSYSCSVAMRDSAAARSAAVGSGSTSCLGVSFRWLGLLVRVYIV